MVLYPPALEAAAEEYSRAILSGGDTSHFNLAEELCKPAHHPWGGGGRVMRMHVQDKEEGMNNAVDMEQRWRE